MKTRIRDWLLALAGLVAAPVVWAINMQLSQILPYPQCQNGKPLLLATSMVALLVALLGAGLSWRLRTRLSHVEGHRTQGFVAGASGLLGAAFAFALVLQVMPMAPTSPNKAGGAGNDGRRSGAGASAFPALWLQRLPYHPRDPGR